MKVNIGLTSEDIAKSLVLLNGLLADHFTLLLKTWQFHWNVIGSSFGSYHEAMLKLYEAEIERVDDVAERVDEEEPTQEFEIDYNARKQKKGMRIKGKIKESVARHKAKAEAEEADLTAAELAARQRRKERRAARKKK